MGRGLRKEKAMKKNKEGEDWRRKKSGLTENSRKIKWEHG
jgi:hypothetical protein